MKASVSSLPATAESAVNLDSAARLLTSKSPFTVLSELIKLRLTSLVLMTTGVGFYLGSARPMDWTAFVNTLVGTGCVAAAAAVLNQWMERAHDARMNRTQDRPLPSGRVDPSSALAGGLIGAVAGLGYLMVTVGRLPALLGAVTLVIYLLIYTPLKRVTVLNTVIGAIPGALPPVIGWTAARGSLDSGGWSLFALLAFWQLPHFLAIAWMYREDYARAGFAMLPVFDETGARTAAQALAHSIGLVAVSLAPFLFGLVGTLYLWGALGLGGMFVWRAVQFRRGVEWASARRLFLASIVYLPGVLGLLVLGKI